MNTKSSLGFEFKRYSPEYISDCEKLFFNVFISEPFNFRITEENMLRYLTDITNYPNFKGFLYFMDGRLIGMCFGIFLDYFQNVSYDIKEIAIAKDCQGSGAGSAFLREIEKELSVSGVKAVSLATQKEIAAFGFYVKNGYAASGSTVYMSKAL